MAPYFNSSPDKTLRIITALGYMSSGIICLIYLLVNSKQSENQFFRYHFYQSILLGIFAMLIGWAGSGLASFLGGIFGLAGGWSGGVLIIQAIGWIATGCGIVIMVADVYGVIQSLRGRYADMPVVTKIVRSNMR
jgi:uncharacterized membrane protein